MMMLDAFQPEGLTLLAVDSIFMMPQLGILSTVHPKASMQVFDRDCLIRLGSSISAAGPSGSAKPGDPCLKVEIDIDGKKVVEEVAFGKMKLIPLEDGKKAKALVQPARQFDVGKGHGRNLETEVVGGVVGIVLDGRGRPFTPPQEAGSRNAKLLEWFHALNMYPEDALAKLMKA